jgi:hypothetical protein
MPQQLKENIKLANTLAIQTLTGTVNTTTTHPGSVLDTKLSEMYSFDTALFLIQIGVLGNAPTVKVKIQEADVSDFSAGITDAAGGEEITVAANNSYKMEIERKKRYLRILVTITSGAAAGTAVVYAGAILCNWVKPFPILS